MLTLPWLDFGGEDEDQDELDVWSWLQEPELRGRRSLQHHS